MLPSRSGPLSDIEKTKDAMQDFGKSSAHKPPVQVEVKSQDMAYAALGVSSQFVGSAVIVFVLAYFLLAFSETLLRQAVESRGTFNEKRNVVELMHNVEGGISRYLLTITLINMGLGVVTGVTMWLLGLPNPVLWGVMAMTLNYVPHVGAILCMTVLFFVGAVTHHSIGQGVLAATCFAFLTAAESYFVTPLVLSKSLQLSPLAVILSILFWGWLWGISGGLIAAPLLAVLKIVADQFDSTRTLAAFLAGTTRAKTPDQPSRAAAGSKQAA
jgi:predicted PurR-regulated permease PerM